MPIQMTDPMNSLISFQEALRAREIVPQRGELHDDLLVLLDHPNGKTRFTYALVKDGDVVAVAMFVPGDPMAGSPCFNTGYAVDPAHRSRGYGKEVVQKAFDELTNGFQRAKIPHLYVEAIVCTSNEHSKALAASLFSATPESCTDGFSGKPALQYVRKLF
jgi:ribosomal protein S18 acetylase RimI-like enzyme